MMPTAVPSTDACAAHDACRSHPRVPVALPGFVHVGGERYAVQIVDISSGGAKVTGNAVFAVGTPVMLTSGTLGLAATIRWQSDRIMGVRFDVELDDRVLATQIVRSKAIAAWREVRELDARAAHD